jgi:hypothetical protein
MERSREREKMTRFDWYEATVPVTTDALVECLTDRLPFDVIKHGRGRNGYAQRLDLVAPGGSLSASVYVPDQDHGHEYPHAVASGDATDAFVQVVRDTFPSHRVSRMDSCWDVDQPGAFDRITKAALQLADLARPRIRVDMQGDWHRGEMGRTLYIGSKSSPVRMRIYEKGIQQMIAEPSLPEHLFSSDLVRIELQVRPQKEAKDLAAVASPETAWGYSAWSKKFADQMRDTNLPTVRANPARLSDDERAYRVMVKQYGRVMWRLIREQGADAFLQTLLDDLREDSKRIRLR